MGVKSILLAITEPQSLIDITQALGTDWEITSVACEEDALEQFEKRSFDVLLVDFNLGSPDASDLLNLALEKHPGTTRFLLAYEADLALVAAKVQGTPQILPKPVEAISVKERIEEGVKDSSTEQVEGERAETPTSPVPAVPSIYAEVLKAIESPGVTIEQVAEIIARDEALTSEILSLTRSSYLGLPRNFKRPVDAVESLGLEAVKAAVMALKYLAENSRLKPAYLSLDQLWQHSINVGQIARDLMLFETKDRELASQALIAGLLHDLGKIVLATNFDDLYGRVHSLSRKQPVAIWDIEKEMFGANHGEIGACLIGMWNLPSAIVEAAALHHEPPLGEQDQLTPLAAVHIANVLERELWLGGEETMVAPVINAPFLNELGLLQRLPVWRAAFANGRPPEAEETELVQSDSRRETAPASASRITGKVSLASPVTASRCPSGRPRRGDGARTAASGRYRRSWIFAGAAGVLVMLAFWFTTNRDLNEGGPVYARTPAPHVASSGFTWKPAPEMSPAAPPQEEVVPAAPVVAEQPAPPVPSERISEPAIYPQASEAPVAVAPVVAITPAPPVVNIQPAPAPEPPPEPVFRIKGIIYTSSRPLAIVNGRTVGLGDRVNGATVVDIGPTSVTLLFKGKHKILELP